MRAHTSFKLYAKRAKQTFGGGGKGAFVDIGCNIGQFSLTAAAYGYDVYSFDADSVNIEQLNKSAQINGFKINTVLALVSDRVSDDSAFTMGGPCGNIYGIPFNEYGKNAVPQKLGSISIDNWWVSAGKPEIGIVKMDIEGSEFLALGGMKRILKEAAPPVYCEYNYAYVPYHNKTFADFVRCFAEQGYKPYVIKRKDALYEIKDGDLFNCNENGNYLFIQKDSSILKDKLVMPYPIRDIRDFADYAAGCAEARYQAGFAAEIINNFELLKGTEFPKRLYDSLKQFKTELSHIELTDNETVLITEVLKRLKSKIIG